MSNPNLPSPQEPEEGGGKPEVRLELTRAGVQKMLALYSDEQPGSRPPESGFSFTLEDLEAAVKARRRLLVFGLLGGLAVAALVSIFSQPLYPVSAQVVIERNDSTRAEPGRSSVGGSAFVATQAEIMESESVLADALSKIERPADYETADQAVAAAVETVRASPVSGTQVVALGYLGPHPNHGVALLESIVDAYRRALRANEVTLQDEKLRAKQAEIEVLEEEAADLEKRLAALRLEKGSVGSADDTAGNQSSLVRDLQAQLSDVRNERIALESRLQTGSEQLAILDPATRSIQEQLWTAEAELARVKVTLTPRHPAVEAAQRNVDVLKAQLRSSSRATPNALRRDLAASRGRERQLESLLEQERSKMAVVEIDRREESLLLGELDRVRELSDERRGELLDQRLVSRLARSGELGVNARIIEAPSVPESAVWPKPLLLLAAGGGAGLLLGLLIAILDLRRERIKKQAEAGWVPPTQAQGSGRVATR